MFQNVNRGKRETKTIISKLSLDRSKRVINASERRLDTACIVVVNDRLHTDIKAWTEDEKPRSNEHKLKGGFDLSDPRLTDPKLSLVKLEESEGPEDITEVAVEKGTHQRKQRREEGNGFADDPAENPGDDDASNPAGPTNGGVVVVVLCAEEDSREQVLGDNRSVEDTDDDSSGEDESKSDLLEDRSKGSDSGGCGVLAGVSVNDNTGDAEKDELGDGDGVESLGELSRILHLGDEGRVHDVPC